MLGLFCLTGWPLTLKLTDFINPLFLIVELNDFSYVIRMNRGHSIGERAIESTWKNACHCFFTSSGLWTVSIFSSSSESLGRRSKYSWSRGYRLLENSTKLPKSYISIPVTIHCLEQEIDLFMRQVGNYILNSNQELRWRDQSILTYFHLTEFVSKKRKSVLLRVNLMLALCQSSMRRVVTSRIYTGEGAVAATVSQVPRTSCKPGDRLLLLFTMWGKKWYKSTK